MKKFVLTSLIILLFGSIVFSQSIVWKQLASLPEGYRNGEAVTLNDKLFFVAGCGATIWPKYFYKYDPDLNTWTKMADLPGAVQNLALAEVNGKIYAIGGDAFRNTNYEYTPETNTWKTLAQMSTARQHIDCGIYENKIYVMGGLTSWASITKKNEAYDIATNSWSEKSEVPSLRNNPAIVTLDSLIYVIGGGGCDTSVWNNIATVECYNVKTNTWQHKSDLPYVLFKPAAVVINNQIIVLGGITGISGQNIGSDKVLLYKAETDEWKEITPLPTMNIFFGCTTIGNKIYVVGGMECLPPNKPFATVYEGELVITDVDEDDIFINDFILYQNYPNPFNPSTTISYSVPFVETHGSLAYRQVGTSVQIKVFDILGNEVVTLVDEYKSAGTYEVEFNASELTSGLYFYKITCGNFSETRKMILLR